MTNNNQPRHGPGNKDGGRFKSKTNSESDIELSKLSSDDEVKKIDAFSVYASFVDLPNEFHLGLSNDLEHTYGPRFKDAHLCSIVGEQEYDDSKYFTPEYHFAVAQDAMPLDNTLRLILADEMASDNSWLKYCDNDVAASDIVSLSSKENLYKHGIVRVAMDNTEINNTVISGPEVALIKEFQRRDIESMKSLLNSYITEVYGYELGDSRFERLIEDIDSNSGLHDPNDYDPDCDRTITLSLQRLQNLDEWNSFAGVLEFPFELDYFRARLELDQENETLEFKINPRFSETVEHAYDISDKCMKE